MRNIGRARIREWLRDPARPLLVEGPAGIGKSTLLQTAVTAACSDGWTVLRCSPGPKETDYQYTGLADLIECVELPEIPSVQRRALDVAAHRADTAQPVDPHLVSVAFASVLRCLAGPVLLVVDDLQWLDRATSAAVEFAVRRSPVAVLVAQRAERPGVPPWNMAFEQLWLSGLSQDETYELIYGRLNRALPRPALSRVHALSEGNPMMALELAAGDGLPSSLVSLVAPRLRSLGQDVLLAAASMTAPTVEALCAGFENAAAGLEAGELAGVLRIEGNTVTFTHPLFAAVLYSEAPAPQRRAVHRRLAAVEPSARARHLALGTIGPDEQIARLLEGSAEVELLRLAVSKTPSTSDAYGSRVARLAEALRDSGDLVAARELLDEEVPKFAAGPLRARALMIRGTIAWHQENGAAATKLLECALDEAATDLELTGQLHALLSSYYRNDLAEAHRHAIAAVSALPDSATQLARIEAQLGLSSGPPSSTVDADDPRTWRGHRELIAGNLSAARQHADAAMIDARQIGQPFAHAARQLRSLVDAHAGDLDSARQVAADGADHAEANGDLANAVAYLHVLMFIAASESDAEAVVTYTARARRHLAAIGIKDPLGPFDPAAERICALAELNHPSAAAELAEFELRYERFPRPWMQPVLARARATLAATQGDITAAIALTEPAPSWNRFDYARVLLLRGRLLRRARQPGTAATTLTEAEAILTSLGCPAWAAMAHSELERVGRRRAATDLTRTERGVADLVAQGMTNKQVAATLFMSPRTVETHVARIYRKLGIRSRAELGRAMT